VTVSIWSFQALFAAGLAGDAHGSTIILSRGASSSDELGAREDVTEATDDDAVFFVFGCDMEHQQTIYSVKCRIALVHCFTIYFYYESHKQYTAGY